MQRFTCPFCGPRDEREFHFMGEAGKTRPDTREEVSDAEWAEYLFMCKNKMGASKEVWVHTPCQEYFTLHRDTMSMDVFSSTSLRKAAS